MQRTMILFAVAIVTAALSVGCSSPSAPAAGSGFGTLSPGQLNVMLKQKNFTFINVHIPYEGEIASTDAFIAYNEITRHLNELPADKSARIVLYCRSGHMSSIAAAELARRGYTNVWHLDGGMVAWEAAGYEIIQNEQ